MTGLVVPILAFVGGIALLIYGVEKFTENLAKSALVLGVSTFILAVVFAGMDFENWAFGIASVVGDLPGVALGSAIGSALFLAGGSVALAGFITPFEAKVPRSYLILMIISPLILLPCILDGVLSRFEGAGLLTAFGLMIFYIYRKERTAEYLRDSEVEEAAEELEGKKWRYPALMIAFTAGIVLGSQLSVWGARGIVQGFGLNETVFGMTIVGLAMSLEEVLLVVTPIKKGRVNIAVGNIVGSLIFFSTGNVGLLAVTRDLSVEASVISFYWPYLFASTLLIGLLLLRGKVAKLEAIPLALIYVSYWILSYTVL
jgi:cation:H+ antiporter